ncbi:MAG: glycine betaine/proline transport system permease protein [Planctomycetota bacterium]|jgi:glycine betaine/proline transport system permease protein
MEESGFSAEPSKLGSSVDDFVIDNKAYYTHEFEKIQSATKIPRSWNLMAAIGGPFWGAARGLWGFFWTFMVLEILALVQIGKGAWGELGADKLARIEKMLPKIQSFMDKYQAALAEGSEDAAGYLARSENLQKVADRLAEEAVAAADGATTYLIVGIVFFIALRLFQGFYANLRYENQYLTWRAEHDNTTVGLSWVRAGFAVILWLAIVPLTLYRFTVGKIAPALEPYTLGFPVEKKDYFAPAANWMEDGFDQLSISGADVFDGVVATIRTVLDGLETVFVDTPWPVVMTVIIVTAFRLAGPRVAIFTAASLAYLAFLGMWETSMITVALLGAAAFLCLLMGIPLGIWFGKSQRAYNASLPVLDFMQTMPAFVYLIPIIAFFGTGKPPGVLATIIFGMPPVIRLTALGMRGVPENTKEAARAFGATKWTLLKDVELPLAMPSIMTGINQTILMCLSMVVIASLIGAKGLGQDVLIALQYAAKGQGMLAGLAILFCAMVIDRIIQGHYKKKTQRYTH